MGIVSQKGEEWIEFFFSNRVLQLQVPVAGGFLLPSETDRTGGNMQLTGTIGHDQFPIRIFLIGIFRDIGCPQEASHLIFITILFQNHKERQVGVLFYITGKVGCFLVNIELFQDDVDTSH